MNVKLKKFASGVLAVAMGLTLLAGCSTPGSGNSGDSGSSGSTNSTNSTDTGNSSETSSTGEKVMRISMTTEPPTLDPQKANSMACQDVLFHTTNGLMRNNSGSVEPAGAETYEVSDDGLTYTFHLRDGVMWSDGQPVTAEDYVYGFQRLMDPDTASPFSFIGEVLKNGREVENGEVPVEELGVSAPDDSTVVIELAYAAPYFPGMLSGSFFTPCRQDLVETYGQDFAASPDKNVYSGPFVLTEWAHDSRIVLTKNEDYWDADSVKLDRVEISILTDPNTPLGMYETGELDYVAVPTSAVEQYRDQAKTFYDGGMDYLQINLNCDNEALKNKDFRQALSYGISRNALNTLAKGGMSDPTSRLVLPGMPGHTNTYDEDYPYEPYPLDGDIAKAQELLASAMATLGVSDASELTFTLNYAEADSTRKIMEVVQDQWKQNLGIEVTLEPVPYAMLYDNQAAGEFEMMYTGWVPDYDDPVAYLELFQSYGGYNYSHYNNADYDAEMEAAQTSQDAKTRWDHLFAAEQIVCDDLPMIVLDASMKYALYDENRLPGFKTYYMGSEWNMIYMDIVE